MTDEAKTEGMSELREARDRAVEAAKVATEASAATQAEFRQFKAATLFEQGGLTEKQATLFLTANPEAEITKEAVGDFIEEYGFTPASSDSAETPKEEAPPADAGLGSFSGAAGSATKGATPPANPKMSKTDFQELLVSNPAAAAEAYAKGQVERSPKNVQARELVKKGIIDH